MHLRPVQMRLSNFIIILKKTRFSQLVEASVFFSSLQTRLVCQTLSRVCNQKSEAYVFNNTLNVKYSFYKLEEEKIS